MLSIDFPIESFQLLGLRQLATLYYYFIFVVIIILLLFIMLILHNTR